MTLDVFAHREKQRQRRLRRVSVFLAVVAAYFYWRWLTGRPPFPSFPSLGPDAMLWVPAGILILLLALVILLPMLGNSRSPHVTYMPEQIEVAFSDVMGLGPVLDEVRHTLSVLLDYSKFRDQMGGRPRRGVLFEGPPGTGKTHVAKAMAKEAGVPFLFVSSTAFQSMWYGMTARKIRAFFRALRKAARQEGGAIGFIEEIDAIGMKRGGESSSELSRTVSASAVSSGTGSVVNELLVQMQSFDEPPPGDRIRGFIIDLVNRYLPHHRQLRKRPLLYNNILLIGATNRAASLDSALMRPGRFDRTLHFDLPARAARRQLIDYFLATKSHDRQLDTDRKRTDLAAWTLGYSPAAIERLFDEALLLALRDNRDALTIDDIRLARMHVEIGLPEQAEYPTHERELIAVHEAGHATVAYLVGQGRILEVLSIVKRKGSLGMLAHRDSEERFTRKRSELLSMIQISLGGLVAEELFYGESGTGPASDLAYATKVAVEMVGSLGMGGSLISFNAVDTGPLSSNLSHRVLANREARRAVEELLNECRDEVSRLLAANRHLVVALQSALLEREELVDEEIMEVLTSADPSHLVVDLRGEEPRVGAPPEAAIRQVPSSQADM